MKTALIGISRIAAVACLILLAAGSAPANAQSVAGTYSGYFVCVPWGHVNFNMLVETPGPGWLLARIEYSASLPPPPRPRGSRVQMQPGPSVRGSVDLTGWLDEKSHRFKLDWFQWGPRQRVDTPLLLYTFQTSIAGTYRPEDETFEGILVYNLCGTFVATRSGRKLKATLNDMPRSSQEQHEPNRMYHALLDEIEAAHRDRALALKPDPSASGRSSDTIRCGPYFLYYDPDFMRQDPESKYLFLPNPGSSRPDLRSWPPYGFTVSFTPPNMTASWIDEVETVSYGYGPFQFRTHSRGRRIPRADVTPVPWLDSLYHGNFEVKKRECGHGIRYAW